MVCLETKNFSRYSTQTGVIGKILFIHSRDKKSFVCHGGQLQCKRIQLGLINAVANFPWEFDIIVRNLKWKSCLVNLYEIISFSKTSDQHIKHVDKNLTGISKTTVTLEISMCRLFRDMVENIGHLIKTGEDR